ncbi:MAG: bifunctional precorrin-2 dehydrogenase/sirohydrochlorin ferrochelatase [Eubacteriales bacterium]|nr:bifunctional precorrin-2 dehydrogenase/sirohydrochlorin ferrochelatase [Eubacteriales bacterium]
MGCFPFYVELEGARGVIVGGGVVAFRKAEKLLPFGPALSVIAPEMDERFLRLEKRLGTGVQKGAALTLIQRRATQEDLADADFVIAATDDEQTNEWISDYCKAHRIPVNVVDDREKCTFFFPALVKDGPLTIGISTDGNSPAAAAHVRKEIESKLPEGLGNTIELLGQLRPQVRKISADQAERAGILEKLFAYSLRKNGEVTYAELLELLYGMK